MGQVYGFSITVDGNAITKIKEIEGGLNNLDKKASSTGSNIKSSFSGIGTAMSGMLATLGVVGVGAGIVSLGKSILTLGSNMQQTQVSFEVMLGSAEKAKSMVGELQQFSKVTPFTSTEVFEGAKMLMNYGVNAQAILPTMKMLGDASMGNAEKMKLMTYAYAQVQATGRLMGQDLMQLVNAGFNPLQEISKKTGRSMADLKEDMSKGKISAQMVTEAFQSVTGAGGRFYGMMDRQSKTVAGLWSMFLDEMQIKFIAAFNKIQPFLTYFLTKAINGLDKLMSVFKSIFSFISENKDVFLAIGAGILIAATAFGVLALAMKVVTIATWAWNTALAMNPVGIVIIGIAALIAILVYCWQHFEKFREIVGGVAYVIGKYVMGMVNYFMNLGAIIKDVFTGNWGEIAKDSKKFITDFNNDFIQGWGKAWEEGAKKGKDSKITFSLKDTLSKASSSLGGGVKGGTTPLTKTALNTSELSGAKGGLGEAKIINIKIDTMQKNDVKNVSDFDRASSNAIEVLTRTLNNLVYSQSATM